MKTADKLKLMKALEQRNAARIAEHIEEAKTKHRDWRREAWTTPTA